MNLYFNYVAGERKMKIDGNGSNESPLSPFIKGICILCMGCFINIVEGSFYLLLSDET